MYIMFGYVANALSLRKKYFENKFKVLICTNYRITIVELIKFLPSCTTSNFEKGNNSKIMLPHDLKFWAIMLPSYLRKQKLLRTIM